MCESKNYENFCVNLDLATRGEPGERSPCCAAGCMGELHGRGLVACEKLFCRLFGQICEKLHQQKFPAMRYIFGAMVNLQNDKYLICVVEYGYCHETVYRVPSTCS